MTGCALYDICTHCVSLHLSASVADPLHPDRQTCVTHISIIICCEYVFRIFFRHKQCGKFLFQFPRHTARVKVSVVAETLDKLTIRSVFKFKEFLNVPANANLSTRCAKCDLCATRPHVHTRVLRLWTNFTT